MKCFDDDGRCISRYIAETGSKINHLAYILLEQLKSEGVSKTELRAVSEYLMGEIFEVSCMSRL
jgi:hypothetical protein